MTSDDITPDVEGESFPVIYSVYGKPTISINGPIIPQSEHNITSVTKGVINAAGDIDTSNEFRNNHNDLHRIFHPNMLFKKYSARRIVATQTRGAFFVLPFYADGKNYIVAGRIRPQRERGEDQPGRTYTQMNAFAFEEKDWAQHAPEFVVDINRWLLATPDLVDRDARESQHKSTFATINHCRNISPISYDITLPNDNSLTNRLLLCLQSNDTLITGSTELVDKPVCEQESEFLVELSMLMRLLSEKQRPLISFCWGFAVQFPYFRLQWIPGQSDVAHKQINALPPASLLTKWRTDYKLKTISDWTKHREKNDSSPSGLNYLLTHAPATANPLDTHLPGNNGMTDDDATPDDSPHVDSNVDSASKKTGPGKLLIVLFFIVATPIAWYLGNRNTTEVPSYDPGLRDPMINTADDAEYAKPKPIPAPGITDIALERNKAAGIIRQEGKAVPPVTPSALTDAIRSRDEYRSKAEALQGQLQQASTVITELQQRAASLEASLSIAHNSANELQSRIDERQRKVDALTAEFAALKKKKDKDAAIEAFESLWIMVAITSSGWAIVENTENHRRYNVGKGSRVGTATVTKIDATRNLVITNRGIIQ